MEFLSDNWEWVAIAILVVDKVVAMSPSKMDDLIWSSVKKILTGLKLKKKQDVGCGESILRSFSNASEELAFTQKWYPLHTHNWRR